jgi:lipoprotein-releasing system ATP-binding protein
MNPNSLVVTQGLSKTFRRPASPPIEVLRQIDLEIYPGDSVAIVGKSGTGKSTLLHLLGTLEAPTAGQVFFLGQDIFTFAEKRLSLFRNRELGFVFQFHYLMLEFTALENVMMPGLLGDMGRKQARTRAEGLLETVGLKGRMSHRPGELSGGEQQRVAVARALMMGPKLLLTDEMTGNLDPITGQQVFEMVQAVHNEFKMAMISVTHDDQMAAAYGRVYRLTDGKLVPERRPPPIRT